MKKVTIFYPILILGALLSLISCDTNDNNNPNLPCDATFINFVSSGDGSTNGTYNLFSNQKSTGFNIPNQLLTNNQNFITPNLGIRYAKSCIDPIAKIVEYRIADARISYDINTNTITQSLFLDGDNPEFLNGNLHYLKTDSSVTPTTFQIIDENANSVSSIFNVNLANSGLINTQSISSTSNNNDKIYYLANTIILEYDNNNGTLSTSQIDTYSASNTVFYFGLEYVDNNTLYALKGTVNTFTTELVKIDISNPALPQISTLMDLTNSTSLSFNAYSIVNANAYVQSDYDACDNSYYFTYTNPAGTNAQPYLVELKLNSNTINEFPGFTGHYYYGLEHFD